MLTFNDASKILGLCQIPTDIQKQILLLFIGFGTPVSEMIKTEVNLLNKNVLTFNEDSKTLWRYKVSFSPSRYIEGTLVCLRNYLVLYELRIAYLSNGSNEMERQHAIKELTESIKTNRGTDLYQMFYGFDKHNWKKNPIGTQSSIIVHNAIEDGIINEFEPMIYYEIDSDDEYY
jgi:hypothetical protein